jgi:CRP/FNR family transcriptional regulator, cyclic AMP receptor protein
MTTSQQAAAAQPKSGLRTLRPGEVLFNDGDNASSLYIIQKGQVRLYKPKGKGFIEIGVLRSGEVIGEMAFFDEDGSGKKRSCSAAALTHLEIIEISFVAFAKTMQSLNPWFKTIINTLAARLRKTNARVKELEDNQASVNYGGKIQGYEFMKPLEVMRILGTLFLVFKSHGEVQGTTLMVNKKILNLYTFDMYQIMESKLETVFTVLSDLGWMEIKEDPDGIPNILLMKNLELVRQIFIFYNTERHLPDDKKMRISEKAEMIIGKMLEKLPANPVIDIPNLRVTDEIKPKFTKYYVLNPVLEELKAKNITVNPDHLEDGRSIGLFGEVVQESGKAYIEADMEKVKKMYPVIRFMNTIRKNNESKA